MECFYHEGASAVGSCRACFKGLCRRCAQQVEGGLACPTGCEAMVRAVVGALMQSVRYQGVSTGLLQSARGLWIGVGGVALFVGVFVIIWALRLPAYQEIAALGLPFLALGFIAFRLARNVGSAGPKAAAQKS
jgi:hypothetical protein